MAQKSVAPFSVAINAANKIVNSFLWFYRISERLYNVTKCIKIQAGRRNGSDILTIFESWARTMRKHATSEGFCVIELNQL
jgi:hypothetical protein